MSKYFKQFKSHVSNSALRYRCIKKPLPDVVRKTGNCGRHGKIRVKRAESVQILA